MLVRNLPIVLGLEDPKGSAIDLQMSDFPLKYSGIKELDMVFPLGTNLAIRGPYIHMELGRDSGLFRVHNPSDIIFLKQIGRAHV